MRKFTKETLSNYNGKNGRPAYIAFNGTVYDVTNNTCLLYTSPSPRDRQKSRMPSSA